MSKKEKEKEIKFVRVSFYVRTVRERKDYLEFLKDYPSKIKDIEIVK